MKGGELHFLQIGGVCDDIDDADILSTAPFPIGQSNYWTEQNPHQILRAQVSQVSDTWKHIKLVCLCLSNIVKEVQISQSKNVFL